MSKAQADQNAALAPSARLVVSLLREISIVKTKCAGITGELGERIVDAKQKFGLHPKALKEAARQLAMPEDKRLDYQRGVELYMDMAREAGMQQEHEGDMLDGPGATRRRRKKDNVVELEPAG